MNKEFLYDPIIRTAVNDSFPELLQELGDDAYIWVRAQIWQESRMNKMAVSPVGARGLMQLMPATAIEMDCLNVFDPMENIFAGVRYMSKQWRHLAEATDPLERLRFTLASYNGGRGYVNQALVLAREAEGLSGSHKGWRLDGRPPGDFQTWGYLRGFLADPMCRCHGKTPDYQQMRDYVSKIEERAMYYRCNTHV